MLALVLLPLFCLLLLLPLSLPLVLPLPAARLALALVIGVEGTLKRVGVGQGQKRVGQRGLVVVGQTGPFAVRVRVGRRKRRRVAASRTFDFAPVTTWGRGRARAATTGTLDRTLGIKGGQAARMTRAEGAYGLTRLTRRGARRRAQSGRHKCLEGIEDGLRAGCCQLCLQLLDTYGYHWGAGG